jgi:hypothetical protein
MHKLRARLDGSASLLEPFPLRPRYMRHRTYQTLQARYMSLSRQNTAMRHLPAIGVGERHGEVPAVPASPRRRIEDVCGAHRAVASGTRYGSLPAPQRGGHAQA